MNGASWLRINVNSWSDSGGIAMTADVYSETHGADDDWLFVGDSITFMSLGSGRTQLPVLVNQLDRTRWPAAINAAIGGATTVSALASIDAVLASFPGRFVVLALGTNDYPPNLQMEALIQRVLAAGKTPIVPLVPWSGPAAVGQESVNLQVNSKIVTVLGKYPNALAGPDFHLLFNQRTDLLQGDGVHPNETGQNFFRQTWAEFIAGITPTVAAGELITLSASADSRTLRAARRIS